MSKLDELQNAINEAAQAGILMLRKSQMSFDFASTNPHHVAYTRTNASGTVSNIAAKGAQTRKEQLGDTTQAIIGKRAINATALHKINGTHEGATGEYHKDGQIHEAVKHQGNWHLTGNYTQQPAAKEAPTGYEYHKKKATEASAKAVDSAGHTAAASAHMEAILQARPSTKEAAFHEEAYKHHMKMATELPSSQPAAKETKPNANAVHEHYPWGRLTKVEGKGVRAVLHPEHQEAVGKLQDGESTRFKDEQGIDWTAKRNGEHVELKAPSRVSGSALRVKHSDVSAEADIEYGHQRGDAPAKTKSKYQHDDWS